MLLATGCELLMEISIDEMNCIVQDWGNYSLFSSSGITKGIVDA